ncbi:hypothetical protein BESB_045580 [Besnoitia besnoiti]|uniref:Uncharacterized protein n=1 Tax=Besnoitia besnoiti TaxID=94643 RepID=A0A2A9MK69_BESBE|nr:hypothetical protein BESB_045580 [Besnoitia besnoiti]PFH36366.1 hypothetical protein BESB_045580 [Besnoitia besnoiti]
MLPATDMRGSAQDPKRQPPREGLEIVSCRNQWMTASNVNCLSHLTYDCLLAGQQAAMAIGGVSCEPSALVYRENQPRHLQTAWPEYVGEQMRCGGSGMPGKKESEEGRFVMVGASSRQSVTALGASGHVLRPPLDVAYRLGYQSLLHPDVRNQQGSHPHVLLSPSPEVVRGCSSRLNAQTPAVAFVCTPPSTASSLSWSDADSQFGIARHSRPPRSSSAEPCTSAPLRVSLPAHARFLEMGGYRHGGVASLSMRPFQWEGWTNSAWGRRSRGTPPTGASQNRLSPSSAGGEVCLQNDEPRDGPLQKSEPYFRANHGSHGQIQLCPSPLEACASSGFQSRSLESASYESLFAAPEAFPLTAPETPQTPPPDNGRNALDDAGDMNAGAPVCPSSIRAEACRPTGDPGLSKSLYIPCKAVGAEQAHAGGLSAPPDSTAGAGAVRHAAEPAGGPRRKGTIPQNPKSPDRGGVTSLPVHLGHFEPSSKRDSANSTSREASPSWQAVPHTEVVKQGRHPQGDGMPVGGGGCRAGRPAAEALHGGAASACRQSCWGSRGQTPKAGGTVSKARGHPPRYFALHDAAQAAPPSPSSCLSLPPLSGPLPCISSIHSPKNSQKGADAKAWPPCATTNCVSPSYLLKASPQPVTDVGLSPRSPVAPDGPEDVVSSPFLDSLCSATNATLTSPASANAGNSRHEEISTFSEPKCPAGRRTDVACALLELRHPHRVRRCSSAPAVCSRAARRARLTEIHPDGLAVPAHARQKSASHRGSFPAASAQSQRRRRWAPAEEASSEAPCVGATAHSCAQESLCEGSDASLESSAASPRRHAGQRRPSSPSMGSAHLSTHPSQTLAGLGETAPAARPMQHQVPGHGGRQFMHSRRDLGSRDPEPVEEVEESDGMQGDEAEAARANVRRTESQLLEQRSEQSSWSCEEPRRRCKVQGNEQLRERAPSRLLLPHELFPEPAETVQSAPVFSSSSPTPHEAKGSADTSFDGGESNWQGGESLTASILWGTEASSCCVTGMSADRTPSTPRMFTCEQRSTPDEIPACLLNGSPSEMMGVHAYGGSVGEPHEGEHGVTAQPRLRDEKGRSSLLPSGIGDRSRPPSPSCGLLDRPLSPLDVTHSRSLRVPPSGALSRERRRSQEGAEAHESTSSARDAEQLLVATERTVCTRPMRPARLSTSLQTCALCISSRSISPRAMASSLQGGSTGEVGVVTRGGECSKTEEKSGLVNALKPDAADTAGDSPGPLGDRARCRAPALVGSQCSKARRVPAGAAGPHAPVENSKTTVGGGPRPFRRKALEGGWPACTPPALGSERSSCASRCRTPPAACDCEEAEAEAVGALGSLEAPRCETSSPAVCSGADDVQRSRESLQLGASNSLNASSAEARPPGAATPAETAEALREPVEALESQGDHASDLRPSQLDCRSTPVGNSSPTKTASALTASDAHTASFERPESQPLRLGAAREAHKKEFSWYGSGAAPDAEGEAEGHKLSGAGAAAAQTRPAANSPRSDRAVCDAVKLGRVVGSKVAVLAEEMRTLRRRNEQLQVLQKKYEKKIYALHSQLRAVTQARRLHGVHAGRAPSELAQPRCWAPPRSLPAVLPFRALSAAVFNAGTRQSAGAFAAGPSEAGGRMRMRRSCSTPWLSLQGGRARGLSMPASIERTRSAQRPGGGAAPFDVFPEWETVCSSRSLSAHPVEKGVRAWSLDRSITLPWVVPAARPCSAAAPLGLLVSRPLLPSVLIKAAGELFTAETPERPPFLHGRTPASCAV